MLIFRRGERRMCKLQNFLSNFIWKLLLNGYFAPKEGKEWLTNPKKWGNETLPRPTGNGQCFAWQCPGENPGRREQLARSSHGTLSKSEPESTLWRSRGRKATEGQPRPQGLLSLLGRRRKCPGALGSKRPPSQ